jgi:hypothetical protein
VGYADAARYSAVARLFASVAQQHCEVFQLHKIHLTADGAEVMVSGFSVCSCDTQVVRENSDSIVEAVRAVYIEEGNDTPPRGCRVALQA